MLTPFEIMIADAIRAADAGADDAHIARVIAGVSADPAWKDLIWLSPELAAGTLATQLAARAEAISKALKLAATVEPNTEPQAVPAKPIHERFEMTEQEFRALPPHKKRELREEAAKHDVKVEKSNADLAKLQAKQAAGTLTPIEKLTLAHLTPGPSKAERRDPMWRRAQEETASLDTLQDLKRGHDQIWPAESQYPQVLRDHHKAESERLAALIAAKRSAA